jgi:hypothetical protein
MRTRHVWLPAAVLVAVALLGAAWLLREGAAGGDGVPARFGEPAGAGAGDVSPGLSALPDPLARPDGAELVPASVAPDVDELASAAPGSRASASVSGRTVDQDGAPVPSVTVSLYRGSTRIETTSDTSGAFRFADLPPGLYRLFVERSSLPEGLLPPWNQHLPREPEHNPDGVFGTSFRLTAGSERAVDLRVFAAGAVRGRIVAPGGEPLGGALLSVRSPSGVSRDARTDEAGRFEIAALHPGAYVTAVRLDPAAPDAATSAPLPVRFELAPRQVLELDDLVAGSAGAALRGSVVDLNGRPVAGLVVTCREERDDGLGGLWTARTDAAGLYELGRVPPVPLLVEVGAPARRADDGPALLREPVDPVRVDARSAGPAVEVPVIRVDAGRPFRVVGRLRVDPGWAGAGDWKASATVRAVDGTGRNEDAEDPEPELRISSSGAFTWSCSTPHSAVELTVVVRGGGSEVEWRERLQPVPDEVRELIVDVP